MTNKEKNIAIAKACGWKPCYKGCDGKTWRYPDDTGCTSNIPDYINDLNAMAIAEGHLTGWGVPDSGQAKEYADNLIHVCVTSKPMTFCIVATAAQRADAFLITLGLLEKNPLT